MSIVVQCTTCRTKLNAPDRAAGKKIKCPRCGDAVEVPDNDFEVVDDQDFEVVEDEPKTPVRKMRPQSVQAVPKKKHHVDDDDEDDREEERIARPKKKKPKKKTSAATSKYSVFISLAIILAIVTGRFFLKNKTPNPDKVDWVSVVALDAGFTARFPGAEPQRGNFFELLNRGTKNASTKNQWDVARAGVIADGWLLEASDRRYLIGCLKLPPQAAAVTTPQALLSSVTEEMTPGTVIDGEKVLSRQNVTFAGHPAIAVVIEGEGMRSRKQASMIFAIPGKIYFLICEGSGVTHDDAMAKAFFGKFEWISKTSPAGATPPPGRR